MFGWGLGEFYTQLSLGLNASILQPDLRDLLDFHVALC